MKHINDGEFAGLQVTNTIVPCTKEDRYATHDSQFGRGGWHEVDTIAERNAIPSERRRDGMACWVKETKTVYLLNGYSWDIFKANVNIEEALQAYVTKEELEARKYATKDYVDAQIIASGHITPEYLEQYATKEYVDEAIASVDHTTYATKDYVDEAVAGIDLSAYATKEFVEGVIAGIEVDVDLSEYAKSADIEATYAKKEDIPAPVDLTPYAKSEDVEKTYAKKEDIPELPDLTPYAKSEDVEATYAKKDELPDLTPYAKSEEVEAVYAKKEDIPAPVDLEPYAKKEDVPGLVDLTPYAEKTYVDETFLKKGEIPDIPSLTDYVKKEEAEATYAKKTELPNLDPYAKKDEIDIPVVSVVVTFDATQYTQAPRKIDGKTWNEMLASMGYSHVDANAPTWQDVLNGTGQWVVLTFKDGSYELVSKVGLTNIGVYGNSDLTNWGTDEQRIALADNNIEIQRFTDMQGKTYDIAVPIETTVETRVVEALTEEVWQELNLDKFEIAKWDGSEHPTSDETLKPELLGKGPYLVRKYVELKVVLDNIKAGAEDIFAFACHSEISLVKGFVRQADYDALLQRIVTLEASVATMQENDMITLEDGTTKTVKQQVQDMTNALTSEYVIYGVEELTE